MRSPNLMLWANWAAMSLAATVAVERRQLSSCASGITFCCRKSDPYGQGDIVYYNDHCTSSGKAQPPDGFNTDINS
jgi:hypothetical protein